MTCAPAITAVQSTDTGLDVTFTCPPDTDPCAEPLVGFRTAWQRADGIAHGNGLILPVPPLTGTEPPPGPAWTMPVHGVPDEPGISVTVSAVYGLACPGPTSDPYPLPHAA
ncbi:hypothetical protein ACIPRL_07875 [Streptomyces sp. NPDC090085]|uniref:hypothetical protein n=1 Tax=Streptomyces sp. NPDC090085 TaxID=3365943 RepID=UPI0037F9433A